MISGITYNFLPFMTLPIYVSLEKIDRRLVEAAQDLYAGPWRPGGTIAGALVGGGLLAVLGLGLQLGLPADGRRRRWRRVLSWARCSCRSRSCG